MDDHSTDNSFNLISNLDERIKVFKNEGEGIISALRQAYKKSSGNIITRMDADDLMPATKLKDLKSNLKRGYVSTGRVEYFSDKDLGEGFKKYETWLNDLCQSDNHFDHIFKECVIASPNWMMFREDFESIGGFKDSVYPEDYHLVFKMWACGLKVTSSKNVTHLWRDHPARASRNLRVYRDQKFYDLKLDFFLKNYQEISLWGAGPSGKKLAQKLIERNVKFIWASDNEKKIGKFIYGVEIESTEKVAKNVIIAVNQRGAKENIKAFLKEKEILSFFEF